MEHDFEHNKEYQHNNDYKLWKIYWNEYPYNYIKIKITKIYISNK